MIGSRLSGNFLGLSMRMWAVVLFAFLVSLSLFRVFNNLNDQILLLTDSRYKIEKAITKLQLDSIDISRRRLNSASDNHNHSGEKDKDIDDDIVIIYNRVPKTGSTSFAGVAYELCTINKYHVIHLNISKSSRTLGLADQRRFINNITNWEEKKPAIYHGHLAFIDFSRFGIEKLPIYINMVREPLDRLISYYYFVRYGDDFRPSLKRRKAGDNESFDECVARDGDDCDPENLWVQIPYFCGHHADCWEPGNQWALEEAKRNLLHHYLVVGITEELKSFLAVLEATLPRFFRGAVALYNEGSKSHLRKTAKKFPPLTETVEKIQSSLIYRMENDFYTYAVDHFHFIRQHTIGRNEDGNLVVKDRRFMYEKIRPR
ncbi:heparan sulfate 2-o-sulfotransferase 1-like [Plakobranchus ocellatus]|uniref:Heparan sulfate 2-o-sulfotransferase 1-like n=1 Tax=Plakobranchus ocellatus TaxID=259542 RepID=A0AAV4B6V7_9GAST|nr:heparan sulfate 2-o-sulfotransferase 1-like [Plakobranchus ocellatus]